MTNFKVYRIIIFYCSNKPDLPQRTKLQPQNHAASTQTLIVKKGHKSVQTHEHRTETLHLSENMKCSLTFTNRKMRDFPDSMPGLFFLNHLRTSSLDVISQDVRITTEHILFGR